MYAEKKSNGNASKFRQYDIDITYEFSKRAYKELGDFIKAIVLFGSMARNSKSKNSDIDILLIIDDATYQITSEVSNAYRSALERIIAEVSTKIHATTLKISSLWDYLIKGDPVATNILRDGLAVLDSGFFEPLQILLFSGRMRPSLESIYSYLERAPIALRNVNGRYFQALNDLYWSTVDSTHAALMKLGYIPPTPNKIPEVLEEASKRRQIPTKHAEFAKRVIGLYEEAKRGLKNKISGAEIDDLKTDAEDFILAMTDIVEGK